jgi:hypothetical protein
MSELADKCRQMASQYERKADSVAANPAAWLMYLELAQKWREMAEHVELQQSLRRRRADPANR